jgi:antirestriction protein ArdC
MGWRHHDAVVAVDFDPLGVPTGSEGKATSGSDRLSCEQWTPYIAGWLKALKSDKRAIFTAASHAQKAADFLHGLQPAIEEEEHRAAA